MFAAVIMLRSKMAKRGRKPKERKGYFYETEENAIIQYISETNTTKREQIFNQILYPALTKMIESIIRRYKLYVPDEEFDQTFRDTISYLMTKINNFRETIVGYDEIELKEVGDNKVVEMDEDEYRLKSRDAMPDDPDYIKVIFTPAQTWDITDWTPFTHYFKKAEHHYKAYSYCGTVCKNYLLFKNMQFKKEQERCTPYDTVADSFENDIKYSVDSPTNEDVAQTLLRGITDEIKAMIDDPQKNSLNENEVKVGSALVELFENWEEILDDGSNKLQKSSVLYFLREETMMTTKELRDNMKCFRNVYLLLKKMAVE